MVVRWGSDRSVVHMAQGSQPLTLCGAEIFGRSASPVRSEVTCQACLDHPDFRKAGLPLSQPERRPPR